MKKHLLIHQAVHGYSEGHRLLASSYQLSGKEQRILLRLSDRSGDIVNGFDEYLTGYPIPDSKFYAFAKTWHAPEMERPGCVWTHTLFIERGNFQDLINTHPLRSLFIRPQKGKPFSIYEEPLTYTPQLEDDTEFVFPEPVKTDFNEHKILYSALFNQLYEKVKSVVLFTQDAYKYEEFVLSLWCQQWPRLRSRFMFCTGSISGRTLQNHPFTVQVAPYQNQSVFAHKYPKLVFIDTRLNDLVMPRTITGTDYRTLRSKNDPLIKFVWHYGARMKPLRKNFGWLAKFYTLTHELHYKGIELSKITEYLASKFPSPNEMPDLKAALYGGVVNAETYSSPLDKEEALLTELFSTEFADIFNINDLCIFERTVNLWKVSPQSIIKLVKTYSGEMELNSIRRECFQAIAKELTPDQAYNLFSENTFLLLTLIDYNPNLAATPLLWSEDNNHGPEIFNTLSNQWRQDIDAETFDRQKIVYSILDANTDKYTDQLYELFGERLVTFILNWYSQSEDYPVLRERWFNYLERHQDSIMEWVTQVNDSPKSKALAAKILSPYSPTVMNRGSYPWLDLAEHGVTQIQRSDLVQVTAFLLALGLMNIDRDAKRLVIDTFEPVYNAALTDSIPWRSWSYLERLAPSKALIFEWDKCRRLEEALITTIKQNHWPDEILLTAARSPKVFWNIVNTANGSSHGRKLIWRLYEKVLKGNISATTEQKNVLNAYFNK